MDERTQRQHAQSFHALHHGTEPLVLFNAWDVISARTIAESFPAVSTSSGAVAAAQGYPDGEHVPLELVVGLVSRMAQAVDAPLSVDLEAGYGETPAEVAQSVLRVVRAGAVGVNLEDGLARHERGLVGAEGHAAKIAAVREAADGEGIRLFINARTDPFLLRIGPPEACLEEAVARAKLYETTGADGIFVPGLTDLRLLEDLTRRTKLPVNVMATPKAPSVAELARAGVRRVSLGAWPLASAMGAVSRAAAAVAATRRYDALDSA